MDKKRWLFSMLTLVLSLIIIELGAVLLEKLDRYLATYQYEAAFRVKKIRQVDYYVRTKAHPYMASNLKFTRRKSPEAYRIFCLGGSAAMGWPHPLSMSYSSYLQQKLNLIAPYQNFEVINAAASTYSSHQVRQIFDEIRNYQPDLIILYTGNNEFLYHYAQRQSKKDLPFATLRLLSRGWQLISPPRDAEQENASFLLDRALGRDEQQVVSPTEKQQLLQEYQENLAYIKKSAQDKGVPLLIMTLPANVKDWRPHASELSLKKNSEMIQDWQHWYQKGKAAKEEGDITKSISCFEEALKMDNKHAALNYEMGQAMLLNGQTGLAQLHLEKALTQDVYPLRASYEMNKVIQNTAKDTTTWLLDVEAILTLEADDHLIGDEQMVDHVHPRVHINEGIAEGVLRVLDDMSVIQMPEKELPQLAPGQEAYQSPDYLQDLFLIYRVMHQFDKVKALYSKCQQLAKHDDAYVPLKNELERFLEVAVPFQALQEAREIGMQDDLFSAKDMHEIRQQYVRANRELLEQVSGISLTTSIRE